VRDTINQILGDLPRDIDQPILDKVDVDAAPILYLSLAAHRPIRDVTEFADKTLRRGPASGSAPPRTASRRPRRRPTSTATRRSCGDPTTVRHQHGCGHRGVKERLDALKTRRPAGYALTVVPDPQCAFTETGRSTISSSRRSRAGCCMVSA
jgi:hypothetical protein